MNIDEGLNQIYLQEGLKDAINQLTAGKLSQIVSTLKTGNMDKIDRSLSFLPKLKIDQLEKISRKDVPNFDKNIKKLNVKNDKMSKYMTIMYANMKSFRDTTYERAKESGNKKLLQKVKIMDSILLSLAMVLRQAAKYGIITIFMAKVLPLILRWLETTHRVIILNQNMESMIALANVAYGYIVIPTIICIILYIMIRIYLTYKNNVQSWDGANSEETYGDYTG